MTSDDAMQRLDTYRKCLRDHGITYQEGRVVYGNFTEYSQEIVRDLMRRNPDLDAVVFASNKMFMSGSFEAVVIFTAYFLLQIKIFVLLGSI